MTNKKSLITAISIHKETNTILNRLQDKLHKTRSELIREMVIYYSKSQAKTESEPNQNYTQNNPSVTLQSFFTLLIEQNKIWPPVIISFAIITRGEQVLICQKRKNDSYVKNISWTFPYTIATSLYPDREISAAIHTHLGLKITSDMILDACFVPDRTIKKTPVMAIYFHFKTNRLQVIKSSEYSKLKWIRKSDIYEYFTTSVPEKVISHLNS